MGCLFGLVSLANHSHKGDAKKKYSVARATVMGDISVLEKDCRDQDAHHSLVNVLYLAFLHMFLSINMISFRVPELHADHPTSRTLIDSGSAFADNSTRI